ncbi:hypothetical protein NL772_26130 [Klebsiella pneumoniae]|uniref:hypothetical protein n=1 Tax=Klebsiella pneumoniae TaxID=573 RepID=UPI0020C35DBE|nr:hypothetical protein [Klebsiella pneumoniae]MCP6775052.1 hypothetical protein [Klebsiella pneumoniae]
MTEIIEKITFGIINEEIKRTTINIACFINAELVKKLPPPLLIPAMKIKIKLTRHDQITSNTDIEVLKDISREKIFTEIEINVKKDANKAITPKREFLAVIISDSNWLC